MESTMPAARAWPSARAALAAARVPVLIFLVSRCALFLLAYASLALVQDPASYPAGAAPWHPFPQNLFIDAWARWDSGWYASIADNGYVNAGQGFYNSKNLAFMPLYPLAMRAFNTVFHNSLLSGIVVSNLAFLGALVLFYHLVRRRFGAERAQAGCLLLTFYPFAFYFSAAYTESLFLLLFVAGFVAAEHERWWLAGLCGALAPLTRLAGIALLPGLALLYAEKTGFDRRRVRPDVLWLGLPVCGLLAYGLYLYLHFGDPLLYFKSLEGWTYPGIDAAISILRAAGAWSRLRTADYSLMFFINLCVTGLAFVTLIPIFRGQGRAYGVASLLLLLASSIGWVSMGRYAAPVFPAFIAWAGFSENRPAFELMVAISALFMGLFMVMFAHSYWLT